MGKKKTSTPILESQLLVPRHAGVSPESVSIFGYTQCLGLAGAQTRRDGLQRIVDTHCHLLSTFTAFRRKYKESSIDSIQAFAKH